MRFALAVVASITFASSADAGKGAFLIPPLEIDLGVGAPIGDHVDTIKPSTEILVGTHWASLMPSRLDAGIGYVGSFRTVDDPTSFEDDEVRIHGGYFALGTRIASGSHWRTFVVARGELLRAYHDGRELSALGTALRVSTELFGTVAVSDRKTGIFGIVALGIYVEATYRDLPAKLGAYGVTSGISCRLPFMVGS